MNKTITRREKEILSLLAFTNKKIALKLGLSKRTVDTYINNLFRKFDSFNKTELLVKSLIQGCISVEELILEQPEEKEQ